MLLTLAQVVRPVRSARGGLGDFQDEPSGHRDRSLVTLVTLPQGLLAAR